MFIAIVFLTFFVLSFLGVRFYPERMREAEQHAQQVRERARERSKRSR